MKLFQKRSMFLFLVYFLIEVQAKGHVCESTEIINFDEVSVFGKITCNLNDNTEISEDGDTILNRDDSMGALEFSRNKKIRHLPIYIKDVYANLAVLAASGCLLTEVSYNTLVGLNKLQVLWLYDNQINHIEPKTFKDLTSLKAVDLSYNKIQILSGRLFAGLKKLQGVGLHENKCISENFVGHQNIIDLMIPQINQRCDHSLGSG